MQIKLENILILVIAAFMLYYLSRCNCGNDFSIGGAYIYTTTDKGREIFLPAYLDSKDNPENYSDKFPELYEGIDLQNIIVYKDQEIKSGKSYFFPDDQGNEILYKGREGRNNYWINVNGDEVINDYEIIDPTYLFNGIVDSSGRWGSM